MERELRRVARTTGNSVTPVEFCSGATGNPGLGARVGTNSWEEIRYFCEITNFTFAAVPGRTLTACSHVFGSLKTARCTCF